MNPSPEIGSALLAGRNLAKVFGPLRAVDDVTVAIQPGSLHSIIGPNGAGKTTLFNLLSGVLRPTQGRVFWRGQDITATPLHRKAHLGLGRSFQITNVFPNLTVLENVRLAVQAKSNHSLNFWQPASHFPADVTRARVAIAQVGLAEKEAQPAVSLPHGDKRKLELAILLAADPEILLLDEPTAGMASEQVPQFLALLRAIREQANKTILLVEHNMQIVMSISDRITVMHQGRLLAEGAPRDILANPEVRRAYLGDNQPL